MAIIQATTTSFRVELMQALHDFTAGTGDTFKIALFRAQADIVGTFGAATTNYSDMGADEVSGTGYTAGGITLTNITPTSGFTPASGSVAYTDFDDAVFSAVTLTTSGALIYNSTSGNRSVAVLNFGGDKTKIASDLTVMFPTADANTAILRFTTPS